MLTWITDAFDTGSEPEAWGERKPDLSRLSHSVPCEAQGPSLVTQVDAKESACNAGDPCSIPGSGRPSGERNGYPLQYSRLENPMDGGAWWATVYGVAKSRT